MQTSKMQSFKKLFAHQDRQDPSGYEAELAPPVARRLPRGDNDRTPTPSLRMPPRSDSPSSSMRSHGSNKVRANVDGAQPLASVQASPLLPPLPQHLNRGKTPERKGEYEAYQGYNPAAFSGASLDDREQGHALSALPSGHHHRRNDSGLIMQDGAAVYVPDYSSNASTSSGVLSRGTSTASTGRSELRHDYKRPNLTSFGDQQDFFLEALRPDRLQRLQLLVSVPHHVLLLYQDLYQRDFVMGEASLHNHTGAMQNAQDGSSLLQERNTAPERFMVTRSIEDSMRQAYGNVLATQDGDKRLCRFLRWALQANVQEQSVLPAYDLNNISALSALEIRALLEPLQLTPLQEIRLRKHCRSLPLRSIHRVGFGSSFSFQYP